MSKKSGFGDIPDEPQPFNKLWLIAVAIVFVTIIALIIFLLSRGGNGSVSENTVTPTMIAEKLTATRIPIEAPTNTPPPIATKTPTVEPTKTAVLPTSTKTAVTPTPTKTPISPTATKVNTRVPSRTPSPTASPTGDINNITAVCTESANIHDLAGNDYISINHYVPMGTTVDVEGRSTNRNWLYIEYDDVEGWVSASRFNVSVPIASVPVADLDDIDPPPPSVTVPPTPSDIAYWQSVESSKHQIEGGRWGIDLLVHVPSGGSYTFAEDGDLSISYLLDGNSHRAGYIKYIVTISGMSCVGPLAGDLHVLRNGQAQEVRNEFTGETGPMFVTSPGC